METLLWPGIFPKQGQAPPTAVYNPRGILGPIPLRILNLKVTYHPLYFMNEFVTDKSKLPQDGAHVFPYMG